MGPWRSAVPGNSHWGHRAPNTETRAKNEARTQELPSPGARRKQPKDHDATAAPPLPRPTDYTTLYKPPHPTHSSRIRPQGPFHHAEGWVSPSGPRQGSPRPVPTHALSHTHILLIAPRPAPCPADWWTTPNRKHGKNLAEKSYFGFLDSLNSKGGVRTYQFSEVIRLSGQI